LLLLTRDIASSKTLRSPTPSPTSCATRMVAGSDRKSLVRSHFYSWCCWRGLNVVPNGSVLRHH
jgi:hypothetical protein